MDTETILQALCAELQQYTSLKVEYNKKVSDLGPRLLVRRIGCKLPMVVRHNEGTIRCLIYVNGILQRGKGGTIELANPRLIEELLAIFKRDLR